MAQQTPSPTDLLTQTQRAIPQLCSGVVPQSFHGKFVVGQIVIDTLQHHRLRLPLDKHFAVLLSLRHIDKMVSCQQQNHSKQFTYHHSLR